MAKTAASASPASAAAAIRANNARVMDKVRAEQPRTRRTKVAKAIEQELPPAEADEDLDVLAAFAAVSDKLLSKFKVPTWKRSLCAFVASFTTGYFVAAGCLTLLDMLLMSAIVVSTPLFIQTFIAVVGIALTLFAAWKVGGYVGRFIFFGDIDDVAGKAWRRVKGFFGSKKEPSSAVLAGA